MIAKKIVLKIKQKKKRQAGPLCKEKKKV